MADRNSSCKILEAALTLFSKRGYEGASTREICELAGITKPTLYYFFENKEGVYRALLRNSMQEFQTIASRSMQQPGPLRDRLKAGIEDIFQDAIRRPRLWRLIYSVVYAFDSPFSADLQEHYLEITQQLRRDLEEAARRGEISPHDTDTRLLILMGSLSEAISNSLLLGSPKLTRKLAHSIIDTVFDGWLPKKTRA